MFSDIALVNFSNQLVELVFSVIAAASRFEKDNGKPGDHGGSVPNSEQAYRRVSSSGHARVAGFSKIDTQALPSGTSQVATEPAVNTGSGHHSLSQLYLEGTGPPDSSPSGLARPIQAYTASVPGSEGSPAKKKPGAPGMGPIISSVRQSSYGGISVTTKKSGDAWTQAQPGQQRGNAECKNMNAWLSTSSGGELKRKRGYTQRRKRRLPLLLPLPRQRPNLTLQE
ncbi:hypothetical protein FRC04_006609 [Tulasnella sp. 424]|nr:hypothetical protein FRC04_006609 [Tulasnella sp. 424]